MIRRYYNILHHVHCHVDCAQAMPLQALAEGVAKRNHAKDGQDAEADGHGLAQPDGAGNGRATEDDRGQERQLNAVRLPVLDAVSAESVCAGVSSGSFSCALSATLCLPSRAYDMARGRKLTQGTDGAAGNDGGKRLSLGVAHDAASGREGGQDEGRVREVLVGVRLRETASAQGLEGRRVWL